MSARLKRIVEGFGVPFSFDAVAICAQDHGVPPAGVSHLDFRHNMFKARLEGNPYPHVLLYKSDEVPVEMNRLRSIAISAGPLPPRKSMSWTVVWRPFSVDPWIFSHAAGIES